MQVTRRQILQAAMLTAASPVVAPVLADRPTRVLIVGAGPAGLSAARQLDQAGLDIQVFEASDRVGGRIHTLRAPFADGLYAEAGAQGLIDSSPGVAYARQLGLEVLPIPFDPTLGSLSYFKGQRIEHRQGEPAALPFEMTPEEAKKSVFELHMLYRRRPIGQLKELEQLRDADLHPTDLDHLDNMSLLDLWQDLGASPGATEAMMSFYVRAYADTPELINVLQLARETASFIGATGGVTVKGGNDRICTEMAKGLGNRVHLGKPVRAVSQHDDGVQLQIEGPSGRESVAGDLVILTPPPPVLRKIEFSPTLSTSCAAALEAAIPVPVTLVYRQTRSRFWQDAGLNGTAQTDLPVGQIAAPLANQPGDRGILASMTYGAEATAMAGMTPEDRQRALSEALQLLYPDSVDLDNAGASYAWGDDPNHLCGHVAFRPGTFVDSTNALRLPQGRVFFAGDTIGGVSGYSHAAFASGNEVAAAIIAAR